MVAILTETMMEALLPESPLKLVNLVKATRSTSVLMIVETNSFGPLSASMITTEFDFVVMTLL